MLTTDSTHGGATLVVDHATHIIRLERWFAANPGLVFEAWTRPEHVACWWSPAGGRLAICEIDLRAGGAFRFVPQGQPDVEFAGVYLDIEPPRRLTFKAMGAVGRVVLDGDESATRLLVEIQCSSSEHLQQFLRSGVDEGTSRTLDNLVAYIDARAR